MTESDTAEMDGELPKTIVTVYSSPTIREHTGVGAEFVTGARTLGDVVRSMDGIYPGFRSAICTGGELSNEFRFYTPSGTLLRDLDAPLGDLTELRLRHFS